MVKYSRSKNIKRMNSRNNHRTNRRNFNRRISNCRKSKRRKYSRRKYSRRKTIRRRNLRGGATITTNAKFQTTATDISRKGNEVTIRMGNPDVRAEAAAPAPRRVTFGGKVTQVIPYNHEEMLSRKEAWNAIIRRKQRVLANNVILEAAKHGDGAEKINQAVTDGGEVNMKDKYGNPVVLLAANFGHTEVLRVLLKLGATVDAKDTHGRTALMMAVRESYVGCVQLLLEGGADPNLRPSRGTYRGKTIYEMATDKKIDAELDSQADTNMASQHDVDASIKIIDLLSS